MMTEQPNALYVESCKCISPVKLYLNIILIFNLKKKLLIICHMSVFISLQFT